jgi:hypothetical protein
VRRKTCDRGRRSDSFARFPSQQFYDGFRKDVETVLNSPSADCSTLPVDPSNHDQILSALERIRDERDDATYGASVDEVLDKILDNTIEAYGSSARDVYSAIISPANAEGDLDTAIAGMNYNTLREAVQCLLRVEADTDETSHRIFSMRSTSAPRGFEAQFKSQWIQSKVLTHLEIHNDSTPQLSLGY